ncbi:partial 5-hydroxybenzimidazole synthase, partial [Rhodocyclaceae bacterium]
AARVAAHVGDMVKLGRKGRDMEMAKARRDLKWEEQYRLGLFGERASEIRASRAPEEESTCTMCGSFCALDNVNAFFKGPLESGAKL